MPRTKKPAEKLTDQGRLYTLEVTLIDGFLTEEFVEKNPVVSRTLQVRGDQTL